MTCSPEAFSRVLIDKALEFRGIINPRLLRVRPRQEILNPVYLSHYLTSSYIATLLSGVATGITMGVLNAGLLKRLSIPISPLALQEDFEALVSDLGNMETQQISCRKNIDSLFQSLLHRAFQGGL